jgi:alkylation response protein AidB-like acyl-CoA dehydrogenase
VDFSIPEELSALCRTVRGFVDREVDHVALEIEETDEGSSEIQKLIIARRLVEEGNPR